MLGSGNGQNRNQNVGVIIAQRRDSSSRPIVLTEDFSSGAIAEGRGEGGAGLP